jgi:hypothetical protein
MLEEEVLEARAGKAIVEQQVGAHAVAAVLFYCFCLSIYACCCISCCCISCCCISCCVLYLLLIINIR